VYLTHILLRMVPLSYGGGCHSKSRWYDDMIILYW